MERDKGGEGVCRGEAGRGGSKKYFSYCWCFKLYKVYILTVQKSEGLYFVKLVQHTRPSLSLIIPSHRPKVHIAYTLSIFSLYKNLKVVLCVTGSAHVPYPPLSYHTFPPPLKLKIFCPSNCYDLFKVFAGNIIN